MNITEEQAVTHAPRSEGQPMAVRERRIKVLISVSIIDADDPWTSGGDVQQFTKHGTQFTAHAAGYKRQDVIDEAGRIARHSAARAIAQHLEER